MLTSLLKFSFCHRPEDYCLVSDSCKMRNAAQYISSSMVVSFVPWSQFLLTTQSGPLTWLDSLIWLHIGVGAQSHVKCFQMYKESTWRSVINLRSVSQTLEPAWSVFKSQLCPSKQFSLGPEATFDWDSIWYLQNGDNNKMPTAKGV